MTKTLAMLDVHSIIVVDREPYAGVTDISDHWPLTVEYKF